MKICGITNPQDADAAVKAGADALGMVFWPESGRFVELDQAAAIAQTVPPHVLRVGVFVDAPVDFVFAALRQCGLNMLQFHGSEPPDYCTQFGAMTMKAFKVRDESYIEVASAYKVDAFLLDSYATGRHGGTGETFNWNLAAGAKRLGKPIFLAGGLTPENVAEAVRRVQPYGVDVSTGVEKSVGQKDADKVARFIAAVRAA